MTIQVCDPYENGGKPLDAEQMKEDLANIDPEWSFDEEKKVLLRKYNFALVNPPGRARIPGTIPSAGPMGCIKFVSTLGNVCLNSDHWFHSATITPRKAEVVVELKTLGRSGVTHADFFLAMHLDALYSNAVRNLVPADTDEAAASCSSSTCCGGGCGAGGSGSGSSSGGCG